jgi:hypothetical protein
MIDDVQSCSEMDLWKIYDSLFFLGCGPNGLTAFDVIPEAELAFDRDVILPCLRCRKFGVSYEQVFGLNADVALKDVGVIGQGQELCLVMPLSGRKELHV